MKYQLPIVLPNAILLELQRRARERNVPVDELIRDLLKDFVKERNEVDQEAYSRNGD